MDISRIIRHDKEFGAFVSCLKEDLRAKTPLPIVINGLAGDEAFKEKGNGFSATDLVSYIGNVIKNGLY